MLATRAADASVPIVYANLVGGQDELVFDGASLVFDEQGLARRAGEAVRRRPARRRHRRARPRSASASSIRVAASRRCRCPRSTSPSAVRPTRASPARIEPTLAPVHEVYEALVLGTRDYVRKNGFADVLIGLSGGIDSALVAAVAVDALGAEHVAGVLMPSRYSSDHSISDAEALAANLGIKSFTVPIEPAHAAFEAMLAPMFDGHGAGPRRGERAGAHPRQRVDDDLEQVRLDGAHHGQQERDGDRLRDALRRHGRRLRGDQGRPEDARVRALQRPQRARRVARSFRAPSSRSRRRRSWRPASSTPTRCRRTTCSTRSSRATSKTTSRSSS